MKSSTFMQIAYLVSQESKCMSWKVGAVIAKNGRIISTGYNGSPAGGVNCCDHAEQEGWTTNQYNPKPPHINKVLLKAECRNAHSEWSKVNEIHAELNAILYAAKNGTSIDGATMYVTLSPCPDCAKAIANSGIKQLVYSETYDRNLPGWEKILEAAGINVFQINKQSLKNLDWSNITNYGVEQ
ncbi:dCMP deaminase [Acinetobacter phage vB_AbaM_Kimel]|uniref:dCMP deaminase n=4 Tax=Lazarusvirus TaxID=2842820 RepID=A0A6B9LQE6_9CAUD|nr:dCMP deaminase [Acinetobacter phage vB_AbaM_Kimel]QKE55910.1 dCMP deaminase [Acinetobacter phage Octan]QKN88150.1 dCMP deaminase [Acinetobacter phage Abraxas]QNO11331.1 dCMP deaminase [Acinetobacter phage Meroveus]UNI74646.1 deoxycytidylate deaminase [Acinetobacter phage AB-Navy4]QHB48368.1 dCMP deaminase [Acinetobacter phage vB_AbaM_Kimel]